MEKHIPMASSKIGDALKGATILKGAAGVEPGSAAPFLVITQFLFESVDSFQASFGAHGEALVADIPNFTNSEPVIQISEVVS